MKKDIHPNYRPVLFKDMATDALFLTQSTVETKKKMKYEDGNEYDVYEIEISSASHPFFTGKQQFIDTAGRIERFNKKYKIHTSEKNKE